MNLSNLFQNPPNFKKLDVENLNLITMASDNKVHMPSGFGGLMRFDEEFKSKIMLKPVHVIGFAILIIVFRIFLNFIY